MVHEDGKDKERDQDEGSRTKSEITPVTTSRDIWAYALQHTTEGEALVSLGEMLEMKRIEWMTQVDFDTGMLLDQIIEVIQFGMKQ